MSAEKLHDALGRSSSQIWEAHPGSSVSSSAGHLDSQTSFLEEVHFCFHQNVGDHCCIWKHKKVIMFKTDILRSTVAQLDVVTKVDNSLRAFYRWKTNSNNALEILNASRNIPFLVQNIKSQGKQRKMYE